MHQKREGVGGGSGTQKFVYQKWPKSTFPFVNFIFSHYETWVKGGWGGILLGSLAALIPPPPCIKLRQCTQLLRSLRLL